MTKASSVDWGERPAAMAIARIPLAYATDSCRVPSASAATVTDAKDWALVLRIIGQMEEERLGSEGDHLSFILGST